MSNGSNIWSFTFADGAAERIAELIETIPANWSWLTGSLSATDELKESGGVAETAGFQLGEFHSINPTIVGPQKEQHRRREEPRLSEILLERKLPLFVLFDRAGVSNDAVTLEVAKQIAAHYVRLGYRGTLSFVRNNENEDRHQARCDMSFNRRSGDGWNVRITLEPELGGKPEHVEPLLKFLPQPPLAAT